MHKLMQRLGALVLAGALLAGTTLAAGMSNFSQDTPYTPFPDVPAGAWYAGDVEQAARLGLFNGKSGGVFDPEGSLTLAEAVTLAAKTCSVYKGGGFTPGGDPWYQNAVSYGLEQGFLTRGVYSDYTQPATRADMAAIFAKALPLEEYTRINRIGAIPDVNSATPNADAIYLLYGAGILTGDTAGAFHPDQTVTRAETAAILNRLALPASRKTVALDVPVNEVATSPDGGARFILPQGWTAREEGERWILSAPSGNVSLTLTSQARGEGNLADYTAEQLDGLRQAAGGAILVIAQPEASVFRGLAGYDFGVEQTDGTQYEVHCVASSARFYTLLLQAGSQSTQDDLDSLYQLAYTLDLEL